MHCPVDLMAVNTYMSTTELGPSRSVEESQSLSELFQARVHFSPAHEAYRQFSSDGDTWVSYSWAEIGARVLRWRAALQRDGLQCGARIGILLPNGIDHVCADQAALSLGLVPVPLHVIDDPENLTYVIADSGSAVLFVESYERWSALAPHRVRLPNLRRVVYQGTPSSAETGFAMALEDWLSSAAVHPFAADSAGPGDPPKRIPPDSLAAIVYTSGTTGRPKGVMLSHRNVMANVRSIMTAIRVLESDVFLSFLPLSHTFERTVGYYLPTAGGASVAFARSIPSLMNDLQVIRPTILVSVPRIYERPVRNRFGGRLRAAVTGGAPMALEVARPFLALGVPVLQGYGMTESAPVIACNSPQDNDPASVGRALPGVAVKLGANEELMAKGDNVMVGYWQRAEETARVKDAEGWLHTGDQASIEAGRILIKGRIKDIIVTSTGEKIAPVDLEAAIVSDPVFEQAMVLGEGRPYPS
jgi:long-chain acyl-CoA synthetase